MKNKPTACMIMLLSNMDTYSSMENMYNYCLHDLAIIFMEDHVSGYCHGLHLSSCKTKAFLNKAFYILHIHGFLKF